VVYFLLLRLKLEPEERQESWTMKSLLFTADELRVLAELLDREIPQLRDAIVQATENYVYRDALRERERLLNVIREKLADNIAVSAPLE